jgi:hypothetical protein
MVGTSSETGTAGLTSPSSAEARQRSEVGSGGPRRGGRERIWPTTADLEGLGGGGGGPVRTCGGVVLKEKEGCAPPPPRPRAGTRRTPLLLPRVFLAERLTWKKGDLGEGGVLHPILLGLYLGKHSNTLLQNKA